ncbi:hypothetical protein FQA47_013536 [Oryzias melastigma]|uniref:MARVEL domain-containing protein n=1 Tax=Oryzias melastigma TaxID=30732 RepID=A0A834F1H5_ORYME|nr:hypothetical protein FQA47_013536 [Oryzias melastigma]
MEETETPRQRSTGEAGREEGRLLGTSKPLHRFVQKEPRIFGVVLVIFGSTELLMGFPLYANGDDSLTVYVPFWLGGLFLSSGILSIYTDLHPSKKMVTVCLAMYVVSMLSIFISLGLRIHVIESFLFHSYIMSNSWSYNRYIQASSIDCILVATSLCVFGLLIFLSTIARLALKSSRTQGDTASD